MSAWWQYTLAMVGTLAVLTAYNHWRERRRDQRMVATFTALAVRVERGAFVEYLDVTTDVDGVEWEYDCDRCDSVGAFLVTVPHQSSRVCARCLGPEVYEISRGPATAQ